jgi:hypothetical protein
MLSKNPNQVKMRVKSPSREALALSRANETPRSKTLAPQGPLQHATRATAAQSASKSIHEAG